jgi:hypothetical protein
MRFKADIDESNIGAYSRIEIEPWPSDVEHE